MPELSKIKSHLETMEAMSPSGFAIAFHIRLTSPDFLFQTYPKAWTDTYSEKGYVMVDPIVRWGLSETGSKRWSSLKHLDDHDIFAQSQEHEMGFGVAISTETDGSRSVAGFARNDREFTDEEIEELSRCVKHLHDLTASKTGMSDDLRARLHDLSVKMTHQ
ncbi:autoinducer binding domain-containing protein [Thalassorhabdomicrobium marinisediminis]|uniref:Transcription factor LuxR-like autoinducer-binding domain-containing protein n=1 Tax=Thalassorhabdomicrobium marinisediminis TaxID=2170577 RepID=A0A2T7G0T8_9RHOB|nr:autoinducer binding domain-containing protein [Thalassorhabdomicrobium marinisediminis]PVA08025.1 hypothetical protein DC363_00555 [Thalassorhabdomicrobium marinisediminis]